MLRVQYLGIRKEILMDFYLEMDLGKQKDLTKETYWDSLTEKRRDFLMVISKDFR
jgi:hypothetical protein